MEPLRDAANGLRTWGGGLVALHQKLCHNVAKTLQTIPKVLQGISIVLKQPKPSQKCRTPSQKHYKPSQNRPTAAKKTITHL